MQLKAYSAVVADPQGQWFAAPLLALDRVEAIRKAINRCRERFGAGSKVKQLTYVGVAEFPHDQEYGMSKSQLLGILKAANDVDRVAFAACELARINQQALQLLADLTAYVESLQNRINGE